MARSKALFREIRDRLGFTQPFLASQLGYEQRSLVRWERPGFVGPPQAAWDYLMKALGDHVKTVRSAVAQAKKSGQKVVRIPYFRSQRDYVAYSGTRVDYRIADARAREVGLLLNMDGVHTEFYYPETAGTRPEAQAKQKEQDKSNK